MTVENIIIHNTDSPFGCAREVRRWHIERGWRDIGYHFVILNGRPGGALYLQALDGAIECGRDLDGDSIVKGDEVGAHALGYNSKSIGVVLVGVEKFTPLQLASLLSLLRGLMAAFNLEPSSIIGHYETATGQQQGKTCPNLNVERVRKELIKNV